MEVRKHIDSLVNIIEIMSRGILYKLIKLGSKMPCFANNDVKEKIQRFIDRFYLTKTENEYIKVVDDLISMSLNNWRTTQYDNFQKLTNDIRP
jgi:phosphatidylinositol kinase/protein kinase (PI-3  family)